MKTEIFKIQVKRSILTILSAVFILIGIFLIKDYKSSINQKKMKEKNDIKFSYELKDNVYELNFLFEKHFDKFVDFDGVFFLYRDNNQLLEEKILEQNNSSLSKNIKLMVIKEDLLKPMKGVFKGKLKVLEFDSLLDYENNLEFELENKENQLILKEIAFSDEIVNLDIKTNKMLLVVGLFLVICVSPLFFISLMSLYQSVLKKDMASKEKEVDLLNPIVVTKLPKFNEKRMIVLSSVDELIKTSKRLGLEIYKCITIKDQVIYYYINSKNLVYILKID